VKKEAAKNAKQQKDDQDSQDKIDNAKAKLDEEVKNSNN